MPFRVLGGTTQPRASGAAASSLNAGSRCVHEVSGIVGGAGGYHGTSLSVS